MLSFNEKCVYWMILSFLFGIGNVDAQIQIDNTVTGTQLANSIMAPTNQIVPGSVVLNCPQGAYGSFTNGLSDGLTIDNGIILTTGQTSIFQQNNIGSSQGVDNGVSNFIDPDLQAIEPLATFDGCLIEFDIIPVCDQLQLSYIWGSDEYPEYVNSGYNDGFGFFVSGPGIAGTQNIATVPGTNTLVSIDNVNGGVNNAFYVDNTGGSLVEYDGYTQNLSATVTVVPCQTYHLKIICADAGDGIFDSGVLISVNNPSCSFNNVDFVGVDTVGIEGCKDLNVILNRSGDTHLPLTVDFQTVGTAADGTDFTYGVTQHIFAANDLALPIAIPVINDAQLEGSETFQLIATINNCGFVFSDTIDLEIQDSNVQLDSVVVHEVCAGNCNGSILVTGNGAGPFTYLWNTGATTSNLTGLCAGQYSVIVTDANSCVGNDTLTVLPGAAYKDATITAPRDTFCLQDTPLNYTASDPGGTWVGAGINSISGEFNPSSAGVGTHQISYEIREACGDTATVNVTVTPLIDGSITPGFETNFCVLDTSYVFTAVTSGGIWLGPGLDTLTGEFNPSAAGVGTHQLVHMIVDSCGSADTISVTVIPVQDPIINASQTSFCLNDDSLNLTVSEAGGTWSGNGMTETTGAFHPGTAGVGFHQIVYTIAGSCGAADTINLTVLPMKNANIHGPDTATVCILDLFHSVTVDVDTGTWDNPNVAMTGTTATIDLTALGEGTHRLIYSFPNPCADSDTIWLEITGVIMATITPPPVFCDDNIVHGFVAANPGGVWQGDGINVNTGEFNPSVAGVGVHEITYTMPGTCGNADTVQVTVIGYDDPTITNNQYLFCIDEGEVALQTVQSGGTWTVTSGNPAGLNAGVPSFNTTQAGVGDLVLNYSFGGQCPVDSSVTFTVEGPVDAGITQPTALCEGYSTSLLQTNVQGGVWSGDVTILNHSIPSGLNEGLYQIIYSFNTTCVSADTVTLEILKVPQTDFTIAPATGCIPLISTFTDASEEVPLVSIWNLGNGTLSTNIGSAAGVYVNPQCYDVSLQNTYANGCVDSIKKNSVVCGMSIPEASFEYRPATLDITDQWARLLNTSTLGDLYNWDMGELAENRYSVEHSPYVKFTVDSEDTATVRLVVSNTFGCTDTAVQKILIQNVPTLYVPNAFTPDGNGRNDVFKPYTNGYTLTRYEFYVYDRWGLKIFETTDPEKGWDGTVNYWYQGSKIAQADVYVWKVIFETGKKSNVPESQVGTVTLIR